jgi:hypothetical protein
MRLLRGPKHPKMSRFYDILSTPWRRVDDMHIAGKEYE